MFDTSLPRFHYNSFQLKDWSKSAPPTWGTNMSSSKACLALIGQRPFKKVPRGSNYWHFFLHRPRTHMQQQKIMTGNHIQPSKNVKCIIYSDWFRGRKKITANTSCQLDLIRPLLCVYILLFENRAMTGRRQKWLHVGSWEKTGGYLNPHTNHLKCNTIPQWLPMIPFQTVCLISGSHTRGK